MRGVQFAAKNHLELARGVDEIRIGFDVAPHSKSDLAQQIEYCAELKPWR